MKFELNDHSVAGFTVRLPRPHGTFIVALGPSEGVSGAVTIDGTTTIDVQSDKHVSVSEVVAPSAGSPFQAHGLIVCERPRVCVTLGGPHLLCNTTATSVRIEAIELEIPSLGAVQLGSVVARGLTIEATAHSQDLVLEALAIASLKAPIAGGTAHLRGLTVEAFQYQGHPSAGGARTVSLRALNIEEVTFVKDGLSVSARNCSLRDLRSSQTELLHAATVAIEAIAIQATGLGGNTTTGGADSTKTKASDFGVPLDLLRSLSGKVSADVKTEINVPIFPNWRATHPVRVAIDNGRIRYKELEASMTRLEDAVLDFNVTEGRLCLDRDLPLIPFDRSTLVAWKLPPEEQAAAEAGWVTLARLAKPTIEVGTSKSTRPPPSDANPPLELPAKKPSPLRELAAGEISVDLDIAPLDPVSLGQLGTITITKPKDTVATTLLIKGQTTYRPDEAPVPGKIGGQLNNLAVDVKNLQSGTRHVSATTTVGKVNVDTWLLGIAPTKVTASIEAFALTGLHIR